MTEIEIVETVTSTLPLKHKFGKLVVGTLAGFVASELAQKAYDVALKRIRNRAEIPQL